MSDAERLPEMMRIGIHKRMAGSGRMVSRIAYEGSADVVFDDPRASILHPPEPHP